jgi:hypothetical protein
MQKAAHLHWTTARCAAFLVFYAGNLDAIEQLIPQGKLSQTMPQRGIGQGAPAFFSHSLGYILHHPLGTFHDIVHIGKILLKFNSYLLAG